MVLRSMILLGKFPGRRVLDYNKENSGSSVPMVLNAPEMGVKIVFSKGTKNPILARSQNFQRKARYISRQQTILSGFLTEKNP